MNPKIPNNKSQFSNNFIVLNSKSLDRHSTGYLVFGNWNLFVIWSLVIGAFLFV